VHGFVNSDDIRPFVRRCLTGLHNLRDVAFPIENQVIRSHGIIDKAERAEYSETGIRVIFYHPVLSQIIDEGDCLL